jgi:hypothetical protein
MYKNGGEYVKCQYGAKDLMEGVGCDEIIGDIILC